MKVTLGIGDRGCDDILRISYRKKALFFWGSSIKLNRYYAYSYNYRRFLNAIIRTFGNSRGNLSLAILRVLLCSFEIFNFLMSPSVGLATLQPISWKYLTILLSLQSALVT